VTDTLLSRASPLPQLIFIIQKRCRLKNADAAARLEGHPVGPEN
jgi:hypothetical protein